MQHQTMCYYLWTVHASATESPALLAVLTVSDHMALYQYIIFCILLVSLQQTTSSYSERIWSVPCLFEVDVSHTEEFIPMLCRCERLCCLWYIGRSGYETGHQGIRVILQDWEILCHSVWKFMSVSVAVIGPRFLMSTSRGSLLVALTSLQACMRMVRGTGVGCPHGAFTVLCCRWIWQGTEEDWNSIKVGWEARTAAAGLEDSSHGKTKKLQKQLDCK